MPRKRRLVKRQLNAETEARAWSETFASGCDFFQELKDIGIEGDALFSAEIRELARDAWRRFGHAYLLDKPLAKKCWALETFGEP